MRVFDIDLPLMPVHGQALFAPPVHAVSELAGLIPGIGQDPDRRDRAVCGLADGNNRLGAIQTELGQFAPQPENRRADGASNVPWRNSPSVLS